MSRDSFKTWTFGVFTAAVLGGSAWAITSCIDSQNRCTRSETRLDAQASDIAEIKADVKETQSDVKELLKRTAKP